MQAGWTGHSQNRVIWRNDSKLSIVGKEVRIRVIYEKKTGLSEIGYASDKLHSTFHLATYTVHVAACLACAAAASKPTWGYPWV